MTLCHLSAVLPKPACQTCPAVEEFFTHKRVLEVFCDSNFGKSLLILLLLKRITTLLLKCFEIRITIMTVSAGISKDGEFGP